MTKQKMICQYLMKVLPIVNLIFLREHQVKQVKTSLKALTNQRVKINAYNRSSISVKTDQIKIYNYETRKTTIITLMVLKSWKMKGIPKKVNKF